MFLHHGKRLLSIFISLRGSKGEPHESLSVVLRRTAPGIVDEEAQVILRLGVVLLGSAIVSSLDSLRERMASGEARRAGKYGASALLGTALTIAN